MTGTRYAGRRLRNGRVSEPGRIYLVTTVTLGRKPLFTDFHLARRVVLALRNQPAHALTLAFVLMPDHLHWLIQLESGDLPRVVGRLKAESARAVGKPIWQRGYHDRMARKEDDIRAMARYLVGNPLRAGLVDDIGEYPHWDAIWL